MSLLHDLLKETAGVTSAHAVAGDRASLFGGGAVDAEKANRRKMVMMRRMGYMPVGEVLKIKQSTTWKEVYEASAETFDKADVISKLDNAERRAKADKDTAVFGLEDEDGAIVKVFVRADQADDFEQALATLLAGADEDEDDENTGAEIAEVLFDLKDKFEIVDVEWGKIEGDPEEEQELEGDPEAEGGDLEGEGGEGGELEGDPEAEGDLEGEDDMVDDEAAATSALQDVIDVMRADAEAKKAEAEARKAEAEAEISKHAAESAASKVSQEEEILDMETHEKAKKDADKEAKTLAKLAKYKHETTGDVDVTKTELSVENEEKSEKPEKRDQGEPREYISKEELADLLLKHMAYN